MSFDDRLRDKLRDVTKSHPLDPQRVLRDIRSGGLPSSVMSSSEPIVAALEDVERPRRRHVRAQRLVGVAAAVVLIVGGVAVPFALQDHPHNTARKILPLRTDKTAKNAKLVNNPIAVQAVASAVTATTNAGSFRVLYSLAETPGTAPTTTVCQPLTSARFPRSLKIGPARTPATRAQTSATECFVPASNNRVTTTGVATVNVGPFAMQAVSNVSSFGPVTVQVDDTDEWETIGSGPPADSAVGSPLSTFASLVESTLGPREGAEAMMGLASPTGYLSIAKAAITSAAKIGTGIINGEPVTNYQVTIDPTLLAAVPGHSSEEITTIDAALAVLQAQGFTGNTTEVSVDANGFVVHTHSVNHFADGGTVSSDDTFSAFGCAGAVELPGRPATVQTSACVDVGTPASAANTTKPSPTANGPATIAARRRPTAKPTTRPAVIAGHRPSRGNAPTTT